MSTSSELEELNERAARLVGWPTVSKLYDTLPLSAAKAILRAFLKASRKA